MNLMLNMKDINKILAKTHFKWKKKKKLKNPTFLWKHVSMTLLEVSLSCLHFSLMVYEGEVKSPYFCKCGEPWVFAIDITLKLFKHFLNRVNIIWIK